MASRARTTPATETTPIRALEAWLDRVGARCQYEMMAPNKRIVTGVYVVLGKHGEHKDKASLLIVQRFYNEVGGYANGFDLFVPSAPAKIEIAATLDAAAEALGLDGCAGLLPEAVPEPVPSHETEPTKVEPFVPDAKLPRPSRRA